MKLKRMILAAMLGLMAATACVSGLFYAPLHHYDVRRDLSVYFANSDRVIESIRSSLKKRAWRITLSFRSHADNMEDIPALVRDMMSFALEDTGDPAEGDYIYHQYGGYEMKYSYEPAGDEYSYTVYITPDYYTSPEQEEQVGSEIKAAVESFGFGRDASDYEKVRTVYDFVKERTDFDEIHKKNENYHLKSTAFGALIYGHAVCQGYAVLMYRMLREAGVDTRVITGTARYEDEEEFHAWNIVCIDGKWYNIDATWDDQSGTEKYFLKSDEDFLFHERDTQFSSEEFYSRYPMAEQSFTS